MYDKLKIQDRNTREALNEIKKQADAGQAGNSEIRNKEITYNDLAGMKEGVRYIDVTKDGVVRFVMRKENRLYALAVPELGQEGTGVSTDSSGDMVELSGYIYDDGGFADSFADHVLDDGSFADSFTDTVVDGGSL